jgi:hypothetical protein
VLPSKWSATIEQMAQPSSQSGPNGERLLALRAIKDVLFFGFDPRLPMPLCAELILQPGEFLLLFEELFTRLDPLGS